MGSGRSSLSQISGSTKDKLGQSPSWEAFLVEDKRTSCLLARLRFMRADQPDKVFKMGCRQKCVMRFNYIYNDPETVTSFAAERCHECQYEFLGTPATVFSITHDMALRF